MKVFVNYRIPITGMDAIDSIHKQLKEKGFDGEWQMHHRSHITLAFYGQIDHSYEDELVKRIQDVVKNIDPFEVTFSRISQFDNDNNRVIWLGVEPENGLAKLHEVLSFPDIDNYRFDEYHPHITLILRAHGPELPTDIEIPKVTLKVDQVTLSGADDSMDYKVIGVAKLRQKRLIRRDGK